MRDMFRVLVLQTSSKKIMDYSKFILKATKIKQS